MSEDHSIAEVDKPDREAAGSESAPPGSGWIRWVALLALLLSAGAVVLALWAGRQVSEVDQGNAQVASLQERLDGTESRLQRLEERLDGIEADTERHGNELGEMRDSLASVSDRQDDYDTRLSELTGDLDESVAQLQRSVGRERESDRSLGLRLGLIEAAGLLRLGQERIELAGDFEGARLAFRQAAERLDAVDDTRVNRARRLVTGELEALERQSRPDWAGIGARLDRLASQSQRWPARTGDEPRTVAADGPDDVDDGGWWASLKGSMQNLVRIRERDAMPVTEEQVDAIREQLQLRLLAAELSAVRARAGELSRHANAARDLIERAFDVEAEAVEAALATLEEIAATDPPAPPRLGEALEEIHRLLDES